jgi:predicted DCC family thiol-disulfide oxidoreductase YuxK
METNKPACLAVVFDGDCSICQASVRWIQRRDSHGVVCCVTSAACTFEDRADLPFSQSVVARASDGTTFFYSKAVGAVLAALPAPWSLLGRTVLWLNRWHPTARVLDGCYLLVANNRLTLSAWLRRLHLLETQCSVPSAPRP